MVIVKRFSSIFRVENGPLGPIKHSACASISVLWQLLKCRTHTIYMLR